ncbi:hypothetical protein [Glycomyces harbinensis]|uniref:Uncharacterized protein n=1 Tax=Glycomyces harbinensis TaxID=58114 RepID=A0A1G6ZQL7_9ACTN|nr:hypothetical protein [Glycomyces harbinensis]SDE04673.1 hypothetical protein SAMN05216270_111137 [Glycomyces harbinensis]
MTDMPNPGALAARSRPRSDADDVEMEVEEALAHLETLADLPVTDHVAVFEGVQQRLSEILSNVDDA